MDLDDVGLFHRVAELGSLSAAARERDVPVSLVSRAITRLESLHKVRLLHRSTHGLSLTEPGQALLEHGKKMLASLADLEAEFASNQAELRGTVHIGLSPAMAHFVIVPSLPALAKRHPHLSVELHVDDRAVDIARQGLDFAIRTGPLGSDNLVARPIGTHGRRLYATPGYLREHGMPTSVDDLDHHHLITNSVIPALNRWPFLVKGKSVMYQPRGHYRASSTGIMMTIALQGLGIVRGNTAICDPLVARGELAYVLNDVIDSPEVPINAVMLQERHRSPKARACIDFFAEWLASHGMPVASATKRAAVKKTAKR
ncbi:MAG: LysR family transcriptional regulator [Burkholderiaceae bacterium]